MGNTATPVKSKQVNATAEVLTVEGERTIVAVVTSNSVDRDFESVDVASLRLPLKGGGYVQASELSGTEPVDIPLLLNHSFNVEDVIGSVRKAYLNDAGELVAEFGVSTRNKAQDLMTLIDEGHLDNAFSITMSDFAYDDQTKVIADAEILEISLVFRGSNKDARLLAVKSLQKGEHMAEDATTLEEKKQQLEELQKEIAAAEAAEATETEETTEVPAESETPDTEAVEPSEGTPETKEAEASEDEETETTVNKETTTVEKSIAIKQVKDVPEVAETAPVSKGMGAFTPNEQREMFVKAFIGKATNNKALIDDVKAKIMGAGTVGDVDISEVFQSEVVAKELQTAYTQYGSVGTLVNKIDIMGAHQWKALRMIDGEGFKPVGLGGAKPEDELDFASAPIVPHEHALIVAWYDAIADQTPLALYNEVIKYIARKYAQLEDTIILSFAGGTFNGEVFEVTGLQPILTTATRTTEWDGEDATFRKVIGEALTKIESGGNVTVVTNRAAWVRVATGTDSNGRPLFEQSGNTVSVGALGSFNVVLSDAVAEGNYVVGVFNDYDLVTRGGLETLMSREASVGAVNLYTQDATAVRSKVHISGAPKAESFYLVTTAAAPIA